ncbi:hypothetical protein GTO89_02880 [Heliobacterium gestii]|uniref:Uncharacterized protein n=1 Tax=Heliomicrobium gestii TaxID=2699 RepID=A0A845L6X5_HELGE|nr:hypothetical protein [Heliomicrobium gestii]MBM7865731.1 hypothetical protein [Heliomicrobium gestii]MZP41978.1 hypothetical protein [Heliomicrobium gestii]
MCTPGTFSNEMQLLIRQLKGRTHRLFHDAQDVAVYLKENRQEIELAELLGQMAVALKEAETAAARAMELAASRQQAAEAQRPSPTATVFNG